MPGLNRYLRVTSTGLLRIDTAAVKHETHLDGKWLLRSSDPSLSAEDIAAGYKQLLEVERGWRDMKTHLDLRPVNHRDEERIRAHVLLCWLALLLIRIAENQIPTRTWRRIREELPDLARRGSSPATPARSTSAPSSPRSARHPARPARHRAAAVPAAHHRHLTQVTTP